MSSNKDFAHAAPGTEGVNPQHPAAAHLTVVDAEAGIVNWGDRKKFAICGFASSTRGLIPIDDPAWVIAGLNQLYRHIPRADVWFDAHEYWREDNVEGTDHEGWLAQCGIPVVMAKVEKDVPTSVRFPLERLVAKHGLDYLTSTVSYMLAYFIDVIDGLVLARLKDVPTNGDPMHVFAEMRKLYAEYTIGIYGIDLVVGTEYEVQKPCAEFWLGIAEGRGITMSIPPQSALLKQSYRYGTTRGPEHGFIKPAEMAARKQQLISQKQVQERTLYTLDGAWQELDLSIKADTAAGVLVPEIKTKRREELSAQRNQAERTLYTLDGAMQQVDYDIQISQLRERGAAIPYPQ